MMTRFQTTQGPNPQGMSQVSRVPRLAVALALLLLLLFAVPPPAARAQLVFTFDQNALAGRPGDTLTFSGTLKNTGTEELFLNGDSFSLPGADLTLDDTPFFDNFPLSLVGGESASGQLFTVSIGPAALSGVSTGSFAILGGTTAGDQNELAAQNFQVVVSAPEPGSGSLLQALLYLGLTGWGLRALSSRYFQTARRGLSSLWGACGLALVAAALTGASGCGSSGQGAIPLTPQGSSGGLLGGSLGGVNPLDPILDPAIQRVVARSPLKGVVYKPAPSNYDGSGTGFYNDSDFANDDFRQLWGPMVRDDIGNLAAAGVNFLHLYDWNQPGSGRSHTNFLNYCQQKGVSVAVPVSAWYVQQVQNNAAPAAWFDAFVAEVYPAGTRHPAVVMWEIGNEFDNGGMGQTADGIARTAKAIVAAEDRAGIPADQRIAFTSPVTYGIRGATGVEGADAVLQLQQAFKNNGIADVFGLRFIASVNSFNPGSDLGPWASTRFPQATNYMPFCLFEMGKEIGLDVKTEDQQRAFYTAQLAAVLPLAKGRGPYLGQCVFSTVNEAWKGGTEATFGIYKISAAGGMGSGLTTSGQSYPIDTWAEKPAFASMRSAYTAP